MPASPGAPKHDPSRPDRPAPADAGLYLASGAAMLLLAGCAMAPALPPAESPEDAPALCRALFERLDHAVAEAGAGDAGTGRIEDFPWLRVNRPLASFRFALNTPVRREAWLLRLAAADEEGRVHELANLPARARGKVAEEWRTAIAGTGLPGEPAAARTDCRERLNERLADDDNAFDRLIGAARPPDEYRDWQRVFGLYPLTRYIVLPRIATHQEVRQQAIDAPADPDAPLRRYAVPAPPADRPPPVPLELSRDALGIPQPTATQQAALFAAHAPAWSIETRSPADRPGALVRKAAKPEVDPARPAEYRHWSWTRFRDNVLVQLSYALWFPERPADGALDIYAGHLDGLIWRVTLAPDGEPLAYESIHPCGCYYTVFPAPGWRVRAPTSGEEPVFAPRPAPRPAGDERIVIRLKTGTHYIAGVDSGSADGAAPLSPLPLSALRSLPLPAGGHRSAFESNGLIPSSRRPERFLLWPLGVPSPGTMRQWGTHAIAFIGKRHFDDPYLLDSLLEPEEP